VRPRKQEMPNRDRDRSVERWLRQAPIVDERPESAEHVGACLDPETLAAWADGGLGAAARSAAEVHVSNCASCQAMLAVLARTAPLAAQPSRSPVRKWLLMFSPALAAAAAVALWVAVGREARVPSSQPAPAAVVAGGPAQSPARDDAAAVGREAEFDERLASRLERQALAEPGARAGKSSSDQEKRIEPKNSTVAPAGERENKETTVTVVTGMSPAPVPPPAAVAPAPNSPSAAADSNANAASRAAPMQQADQAQMSPRQQAAGEPAAEQSVVDACPGQQAARKSAVDAYGDSANFLGVRPRPVAFISADSGSRWRVLDGRTVQRSLDVGVTWVDQYRADTGVILHAGVAPSASTCWFVGSAGTVLLTAGGNAWQRVTAPVAADLIAIKASDGRTATVTASNGRQYETTDGGQTWTPR
jgi:hypothetical protein